MGYATTASGAISTAMGEATTASATNSTAAGYQSFAGGTYSIAAGYRDTVTNGSIGGIALGHGSKVSNNYAVALGHNTEASGSRATATGYLSHASGDYSTALGRETLASGHYSTALGMESTSESNYSISIGFKDTVFSSAFSGVAIGHLNKVFGDYGVALGRQTTASGDQSTALGYQSLASGQTALAAGHNTVASGNSSVALGNGTTANGAYAAAIGKDNISNGFAGTVVGMNNDSLVSSQNSSNTTTPLFIVGNGNSSVDRSNAMVVRKDGRTIIDELQIMGGSDLAEYFNVDGGESMIQPGLVVSIDPDNPGALSIAHQARDRKVVGVISGANGIEAGMMMGQKGTIAYGEYPVAIAGRVYVLVDESKGKITPGDFLTSSDVPGYAMRVKKPRKADGAILGKALTSPDENDFVLILVHLQ